MFSGNMLPCLYVDWILFMEVNVGPKKELS